MKQFTVLVLLAGLATASPHARAQALPTAVQSNIAQDWMTRWQSNILQDSAKSRYCDREMGEQCGWLISPFLEGFYYGYLATHDTAWIDCLTDWADSWIKRGIKEPDGYIGWPKPDGASTDTVRGLYTDNMLGDAMAFRPIVLMSGVILKDPALNAKYGAKARSYLSLAEQTFNKWDTRGCWREVKQGGVWIVPEWGIDQATGKWTDGYAHRATEGFSLTANKQNLIAEWMIAMFDVTGKPIYKERAQKWWQVMKSRIRLSANGRYTVWNYWDPAGPWDYKPDGSPRHWVGVHPNGGYYGIDLDSMVKAYEHGIVFTKADIDRFIATNRDYMWNHQVAGAKFQSIGGGKPDPRWSDSPGILWEALIPYDPTLQKIFEANFNPADWGGLGTTPWYIAREFKSNKPVD